MGTIIGQPMMPQTALNSVEHNYITSYKLLLLKHIRTNYNLTDTMGLSDDDTKKQVMLLTSTAIPIRNCTFEWLGTLFKYVYDKDGVLVYDNSTGLWKLERDEETLCNILLDFFTALCEEATKARDKVMLIYASTFFSNPSKVRTLANRIKNSIHLRIEKNSELIDSVENYRYFKDANGKRYLMDISSPTFNLQPVSLSDVQDMHLMHTTPVAIDTTGADPELWLQLINTYMLGDPDKIEYMYKVLAYLMSPYNYNQAYIYFIGDNGRNGKGTILKVLQDILGPHAARMNADLLNAAPPISFKRDDALAACEGKSLLIFNEIQERMMASTRNIKELTEGGRDEYGNKILVSVRPSYSKTYDIAICGTPLIAANSLLNLNEWDNIGPIFKRLVLVSFDYEIQVEDPTILSRLAQEYPKIQAWLYRNYFKYKGIRIKDEPKPADFEARFLSYRDDSDILGTFWKECVLITNNDSDHVRKSAIYDLYKAYCLRNGRKPIKNVGSDGFSNLIKPYTSKLKLVNLSNVQTYCGIKVSDDFLANVGKA